MLNLILQRRKALGNCLALFGLRSIFLSRNGLVHVINGAGLITSNNIR